MPHAGQLQMGKEACSVEEVVNKCLTIGNELSCGGCPVVNDLIFCIHKLALAVISFQNWTMKALMPFGFFERTTHHRGTNALCVSARQ
jgi:hypothetical protein